MEETSDRYKLQEEFEKGIEKGKIEVARNLLAAGIEVDVVIQATGLSREEIGKI